MPEYDNIQAVDNRGILYDIYPSRDGWTKLQLNVLFPTLVEFLDKDCETNKDVYCHHPAFEGKFKEIVIEN